MDTKTKKKILYVITKSSWGGAQRYIFDLATGLPKDRFDVLVAAGGNGLLVKKLKEASIRFVSIPPFERDITLLNDIRSFCELYRIFRREKPDIIHLNSSKAGGLGAVAAFLYKITNYQLPIINNQSPVTIFTVHGWGFRESRPKWQNAAIFFFSWLAAKFQDRLIHVAQSDCEATKRLLVAPTQKAHYIGLGIKPLVFTSRVETRKFFSQITDLALPDDTVLIGAVAELTRNKGLDHLINAIGLIELQSTSHKLQAIIIGDGEEREKIQNQIRALGLENTVHLPGFIPDAWQYLKAFDIFVLPSLKEGLPYTLLEAANAGLPIIATTAGGIPDFLEHKKNGLLVPPADSIALAGAITALIDNKEKAEEFGTYGQKKAASEFSFSEMLKKTTALYDV